ncbi:hypothetical protein [Ancylobacter sp. G4_0304]
MTLNPRLRTRRYRRPGDALTTFLVFLTLMVGSLSTLVGLLQAVR